MKQKLYYLLLILGLFLSHNIQAQTLQTGDIAFIGVNIDSDDTFSFIALKDLPAGETVFFADEGWESSNVWGVPGEGHIAWTIPAGVTTGTIVTITQLGTNIYDVTPASVVSESDISFALSIAGDQIIAYQSSGNIVRPAAPVFIAAIHMDYNSTNYNTTTKWSTVVSGGSAESTLPMGLTNGVNAVSLLNNLPEYDNARYSGTLTGTTDEVRTLINDASNWQFDNSTPYDLTATGYATPNITSAPSCTMTASITSQTNIACNGGATGSLTVTPSSGTGPYTYAWDDGSTQTTATAFGLSAGTYTVTVTDDNGCTDTASATITEPTMLTLAESLTDVFCNGDSTGAINLTVSGGTSPYTYLWSNNATTQDLSGLSAGTYSVTVTDANGCTATDSYTLFQPDAIAITGTTNNVSCNGGSNGSIDVNVTGGIPSYSYSWSNSATTQDLAGLTAGTYVLTVTDALGCISTESFTVTEPAGLFASTTATDVSCNAGSNGTVDLTVTGGTAPYSFVWNNTATTEDLAGLNAGTYSVTVTDANGCTTTTSADVLEPAILMASATATDVSCNAGSNGTVDLTVTGGTAPYSFVWNNTATTEDLAGLNAGTYSVTVTDANGCTTTTSADVLEPAGLFASTTATDVSCNAGSNGTVDLTVTGGTAPYSFVWNNTATTEDLAGLNAGTYSVTVTDANGCTTTTSADVLEPAILMASATATDVSCNAGSNGTVDLTVTGGTAPYSFVWNNTATTEDLAGLNAGTYSVTVTDANGCTTTTSADVLEPAILMASATATDVSCNAGSNGTVDLTVTGGTAPYSFVWNNTATTEDLAGLNAGTYSVTVTDVNGCTTTTSADVLEPAGLFASTTATDVSCNAGSNGTVDLTVTGGTAPYSFVWNNTATTEDLAGLNAGTYSVTVTDANGCTATTSATITEPVLFQASTVVDSNVSCNGDSSGSVTINLTGGGGPFEYTINGTTYSNFPDPSLPVAGLSAGTYPVTVTDANGCTATTSATITEPALFQASTVVDSNASCNGDSNGSVTINLTGGVGPFEYTINGTTYSNFPDPSLPVAGLSAGTYPVTVTDANGCTATTSATITRACII